LQSPWENIEDQVFEVKKNILSKRYTDRKPNKIVSDLGDVDEFVE
jgi:hypothetical protein